MPPEFIYFDLGNVLLLFDQTKALQQMSAVANISPEHVHAALVDSGLQDRYEHGSVSSQQYYEEFSKLTNTAADYDQLWLAGCDMFSLNYSVVPLLAHLRSAGYRLGILSNTCEAHWDFVGKGKYTVIQAYFDEYILSFEVGSMKPEPDIYKAAQARAGVDASSIFFCDDREENVQGAREQGWDAELYTTPVRLAAALRSRGVEFNY